MAIRFGPIKVTTTAPSPAATDSVLIKKDGGELREATFTELGLGMVVDSTIDLPTTDGTADQVITTDRADTLSWDDRVMVKQYTFEEQALVAGAAASTYTASCVIPAGAWLLDIMVTNTVVWDDSGTAALTVGTSTPNDADGFFTSTNLKATDLVPGEYLSVYDDGAWGGLNGAYLTTAGVRYHYLATTRTVTATILAQNGDGTAGRTRMLVVYAVPSSTTAITPVAT